MDLNNVDFATMNRKAIEMVELVMGAEPYCNLDEDAQASTRATLLPQYLRIVMEEAKAAKSVVVPPPQPPFDPNVASALYETTNVLRDL